MIAFAFSLYSCSGPSEGTTPSEGTIPREETVSPEVSSTPDENMF